MVRLTCPVYEAAKNGHEDALQLLIEHGADINRAAIPSQRSVRRKTD